MNRYAIIDNDGNITAFTTNSKLGGVNTQGVNIDGITTELALLKAIKMQAVRSHYQNRVNELSNNYSSYEVETFATQQAEWKLWVADSNAPTPFIDAIAAARGIDRAVLLDKIGANALNIASILGLQQAKEDAIKACTTTDEVEAVVI